MFRKGTSRCYLGRQNETGPRQNRNCSSPASFQSAIRFAAGYAFTPGISARLLYAPLLEGNSYLYMDREDFIPTPYIDKLYRELDWRIRSLKGTWGEWPDVTKLSMIATAEPAPQAVIDAVRGHWDVIVHAPGLMEMVPPGIDKGTGLKMALEALGISRRDSVAFGDSANDMAMFRESGLNIGMGGGSPALLAKADHVTTPLHEDGIWNAWQWLKERA